jgi:hypothetical protein
MKNPSLFRLWIASSLLALAMAALMGVAGRTLCAEAAPLGIVSFQFSWTPEGAARILDGWDASQRAAALFSTRMDFAFLLSYGISLSAGALLFGGRFAGAASAGAAAAAIADAFENVLLIRLLEFGPASGGAGAMGAAASVKFALVSAALLYVGVGAGRRAFG